MSHLMIDFETLATSPRAKVLSLGAVYRGINHNGEVATVEKEWFFNLKTQGNRVEDQPTIDWWAKQSPQARLVFDQCNFKGQDLGFWVEEFKSWVDNFHDVKIWGNGALFDIAIVNDIFDQFSTPKPWKYHNEMCYRTMAKMCGVGKGNRLRGTVHNALDDARFQMDNLWAWLEAQKA